jgi:hypothetical protein
MGKIFTFIFVVLAFFNQAKADEFMGAGGLYARLEMRNGFINKHFGGYRVNTTKNRYITLYVKRGDVESYTFCVLRGVVFTAGSDDGFACERYWDTSTGAYAPVINLHFTRSIDRGDTSYMLSDITYLDDAAKKSRLPEVLGEGPHELIPIFGSGSGHPDASALALSAYIREAVKELVEQFKARVIYEVSNQMVLSVEIRLDDGAKLVASASILKIPGKPQEGVTSKDEILTRLRASLPELPR